MLKPNSAVNTDSLCIFALVAARRFGYRSRSENEGGLIRP